MLRRKIQRRNDALPSDDATLQIVELNEFPKAAGVVILRRSCVAKGLFVQTVTTISDVFLTVTSPQSKHFKCLQSNYYKSQCEDARRFLLSTICSKQHK